MVWCGAAMPGLGDVGGCLAGSGSAVRVCVFGGMWVCDGVWWGVFVIQCLFMGWLFEAYLDAAGGDAGACGGGDIEGEVVGGSFDGDGDARLQGDGA